jgi:two-component system sensor histidine kinase AlgZ
VEISAELESLELPSLILQPLVENAVTHGIGRATDGGDIVVRASCVEANATIEVVNTCPEPASAAPSRDGQKIAQSNSRRRLTLMYGQSARLEAGFMNGGRAYRAAIIVPCPAGTVEKDDDASENPHR